jgi:hypothetical protein
VSLEKSQEIMAIVETPLFIDKNVNSLVKLYAGELSTDKSINRFVIID